MNSPDTLNKTYRIIVEKFIETGHAPHYTEIASRLSVPVETGRQVLHELISLGIAGTWLFPGTDYISSLAPFSNLPTQYQIAIGGEQKWYGQ